jgi:hypothetical protein
MKIEKQINEERGIHYVASEDLPLGFCGFIPKIP